MRIKTAIIIVALLSTLGIDSVFGQTPKPHNGVQPEQQPLIQQNSAPQQASLNSTAMKGLRNNQALKAIPVLNCRFDSILGVGSDLGDISKIQRFREERQDKLSDMWDLKSSIFEALNSLGGSMASHEENMMSFKESARSGNTEALRTIREEAAEFSKDSAAYQELRNKIATVNENIGNIQTDLSRSRSLINTTITRISEQHDFKRMVSNNFLILIGIIIVAFFGSLTMRPKNSHHAAMTSLMNEKGLQFITLFVLIIAVVLFGILGILEGRELGAILSGIAGYVLGRGTIGDKAKLPTAPPPPDPAAVVNGTPK